MCDNCPDPVLSLLEALADQYGYALTPKVPTTMAEPKPDPLAEVKAQWEAMPLPELRQTVIDLGAKWRALYKRDSEYATIARRVADAYYRDEKEYDVRESHPKWWPVVPKEYTEETNAAKSALEAAQAVYKRKSMDHVTALIAEAWENREQ